MVKTEWGSMLALTQTAWRECALLGQRQIDVEHLFLATLHDPSVGRLMQTHGVTVDGTRAAVGEAIRREVEVLGLDVSALLPQERRAAEDLHHDAVGDIDLSPRAAELGSQFTTTLALARALTDDSTVADLMAVQGADVPRVREALAIEPKGDETEPVDPARLSGIELIDGSLGPALRRTSSFTATFAEVWRRVSTAEGAVVWLAGAHEDPTVHGSDEISAIGHLPRAARIAGFTHSALTWRLLTAHGSAQAGEGLAIWQSTVVTRVWGVERVRPGLWHHLTVRAEGSGTTVELVSGGVRPRRISPVSDPLTRMGLRIANSSKLHLLGVALDPANDVP